MVNIASDPIDIMWENLGGSTRGVFIFRRLILHALTILVIIFISTPTAMLSTLKYIDVFGFAPFDFDKMPIFVKNNFPPLIILGINQIILMLIDLSSIAEKHETHSLY